MKHSINSHKYGGIFDILLKERLRDLEDQMNADPNFGTTPKSPLLFSKKKKESK